MQSSFSTRQVNRRFQGLLGALKTGQARPTADVIRELAELSQALEDAPARSNVVARMTVTRANNEKVIVEIHDNATFHTFYHHFAQQGNRRSTKKHTRTSNRNDAPGLESLAQKLTMCQFPSNPITSIKIRIIKKRIYRRLISARPDELGLTPCSPVPLYRRFTALAGRS